MHIYSPYAWILSYIKKRFALYSAESYKETITNEKEFPW